ncbi:MAG: QueT transporter family protein [Clostridia bacterium]|nr:QueT transporter family protein [Clostridia bacterium]
MKNNKSLTKRLCRAGVIAALYVALTYAFMPFAFGPIQVRPAEALCILPLFFPEAAPALFIGCALSNIASPYAVYDVTIGATATLVAALATYGVGRLFRNDWAKMMLGGAFPVLVNAFVIPLVIVFLCGGGEGYTSVTVAYFTYVFSLLLTELVWVYALGIPLYFGVKRLKNAH